MACKSGRFPSVLLAHDHGAVPLECSTKLVLTVVDLTSGCILPHHEDTTMSGEQFNRVFWQASAPQHWLLVGEWAPSPTPLASSDEAKPLQPLLTWELSCSGKWKKGNKRQWNTEHICYVLAVWFFATLCMLASYTNLAYHCSSAVSSDTWTTTHHFQYKTCNNVPPNPPSQICIIRWLARSVTRNKIWF